MFKLNMEKAKELHKHRIRIARLRLLKNLDLEFMRALETGDNEKLEEVKQKKQVLRDITKCPELECAECLEDLKNYWPEELHCDNPYCKDHSYDVFPYPDNINPNIDIDNNYNAKAFEKFDKNN
jgi:hypothetical protein